MPVLTGMNVTGSQGLAGPVASPLVTIRATFELEPAGSADALALEVFGGKLFDSDAEVAANLAAAREPLGGAAPSWALIGGGTGPENTTAQVARAGGPHAGTVLLLGSQAYAGPGRIGGGLRAVVEALTTA